MRPENIEKNEKWMSKIKQGRGSELDDHDGTTIGKGSTIGMVTGHISIIFTIRIKRKVICIRSSWNF